MLILGLWLVNTNKCYAHDFYEITTQVANDTIITNDTIIEVPELVVTADEYIEEEEEEIVNRYQDHSPQKATLLSATLPGMGQIYNGKYWKVPIIYAGFGAVAYFILFNNELYQDYRLAYVARIDGNPNTSPSEEFSRHATEVLQRGMNYYRRNLEISYIAGVALYVLNILDATVDAHLLDFDVGEDLSLHIQPSVKGYQNIGNTKPVTGLTFTFRF